MGILSARGTGSVLGSLSLVRMECSETGRIRMCGSASYALITYETA